MKKQEVLFVVGLLLLLMSCGERQQYRDALSRAEAVMNDRPDSALTILDSLGQHEKEFGRHFRMQYLLHRTNAKNKTNVIFTTDSLAKELVSYFDSHGTANERLLAHYLLGMAYSDIGEAPKAINSFQDAIDAADTTLTEFNFHQLSCVYSQMATIFHKQLLLSNEINARKKASQYAFRAGQTKWGIYNQAISSGAYILMNMKDSAEIVLRSALAKYRNNGYAQAALRHSRTLIHLLVEQPDKLPEAKALMEQFEAESDMFDEYGELPPLQRHYYEYRGKYYEGINQLDSAEYFYRKIYRHGMSFVSLDPMYRGLLSVYKKRHQSDSIAKYAQLYCQANDSSIALKDRSIIAQMAATYSYNRLQKEVYKSEIKAYWRFVGLIIAMVLILLFIVVSFLIWRYYKRKIKVIKTEYVESSEKYKMNLRKLEVLSDAHNKVIETIQQELNKAYDESSVFRTKYANLQQTISLLCQEYESNKAALLEENKELKEKIEKLQKNETISKYIHVSESFMDELIVKQILNLADKRVGPPRESYWIELTKVFGKSFPTLYRELCQNCNTTQNIRVCILTILAIRNDDQAILLNTTKQRVTNIKSFLNKALFNETSSRTLRRNLVVHYNIYGIE